VMILGTRRQCPERAGGDREKPGKNRLQALWRQVVARKRSGRICTLVSLLLPSGLGRAFFRNRLEHLLEGTDPDAAGSFPGEPLRIAFRHEIGGKSELGCFSGSECTVTDASYFSGQATSPQTTRSAGSGLSRYVLISAVIMRDPAAGSTSRTPPAR